MNSKKDIRPVDEEGRPHGTWESYYPNGLLDYKGTFIHGVPHGFWEEYYSNGNLWQKGMLSRGRKIGIWFEQTQKKYYI